MNDNSVTLSNPILTFIGAFGILAIGMAIAAHWHPPMSTVVWMALTGAALVVLHDLLYAMLFASYVSAMMRKNSEREKAARFNAKS